MQIDFIYLLHITLWIQGPEHFLVHITNLDFHPNDTYSSQASNVNEQQKKT